MQAEAIQPRRFFSVKRALPVTAFWMATMPAPASATPWPPVPAPEKVSTYVIADELQTNGVPMRIHGFVSALPPLAVAAAFTQAAGVKLVESVGDGSIILGGAVRGHYLTIRIQPSGARSTGVIALSPINPAPGLAERARMHIQASLSRLPSGSQAVSHISANDPDAKRVTLMVVNDASETFNAERVTALLSESHYILERTDRAAGPGRTMWYRGVAKEAVATIRAAPGGRALVVIATTDFGQRGARP